jgi:hypothetical protein
MLSLAMALMLVFSFAAGIQTRPASAQPAAAAEAISITDAAGDPWVDVSVDSFTPDFTGYDRNYAPARGFQFAHITVTITNTGASPFSPNAYSFVLIDTEGFVSDSAFVVVDETQAPPMLGSEILEPGQSETGSVVFEMLAGTEAAAIGYSVTWDRFTFLALNGTPPALGETVEVLGPDAQPIANITVDEWLDPLPGVDSSSAPERGHHFGAAVVTIENIGGGPIQTDPWTFKMVDSDGYESSGSNPYRPEPEIEDLPYTELATGDSLTGIVSFQVFNTATPSFITFDTGDQVTLLAAFPDAPSLPELSSLPEVEAPAPPVNGADDEEDATDDEDSTDDGTSGQVSEECQAADDWLNDFFAELETSSISGFDFSDAVDMTVEELEEIRNGFEEFQDLIDEADPPALAAGIIDSYGVIVEYALDSMDDLIDAAENGEDLEPLVEAILDDEEAFDPFDQAFDEYLEACPIQD